MYALHPSLQCIMRKAQSVLFFRSLLITYVITLSLEKEFIVFEKVWKKSRILDPKICPNLGFGALNPSLQFCIFTFISVGSIPHSYLFTSATGRIGVHTVSKYGKKPIQCVTLHFRDRRGAASVRHRNRAALTVLVCEQKPFMV